MKLSDSKTIGKFLSLSNRADPAKDGAIPSDAPPGEDKAHADTTPVAVSDAEDVASDGSAVGSKSEASSGASVHDVEVDASSVGVATGANNADGQALDDGADLYDKEPSGAYETARALGVVIPDSREKLLRNVHLCLEDVFRRLISDGEDKDMIWLMVSSMAGEFKGVIAKDANIATIICRERVKTNPLSWHCLYTAILAMELAWYSGEDLEASVYDIGGAALLHDAGLLAFSDGKNIVNDEQRSEFRQHVTQGVELARKAGAPDVVLAMIQQHHERRDGAGFPDGIEGGAMLKCSQVVALSNVFEHAMIDIAGVRQSLADNAFGMSQVFAEYSGAYKTSLIKTMMALIGYYPVGSLVELSNRSIGEVVMQNRNMPLRPVVKILVDSAGQHPDRLKLIDLNEMRVVSVMRTLRSNGEAP